MSELSLDSIRFGTDGWRAAIAGQYTFFNVARTAQGIADHGLANWDLSGGVVVGYDRRFGSDLFALTVCQVLCANGIACDLTDSPAPTPAIAYAVGTSAAGAAIIVTASHNPPTDNGLKLRDATGAAIAPRELFRIEEAIAAAGGKFKSIEVSAAESSGILNRFDAAPAYLAQLQSHFDLAALAGCGRIVLDSMFGSGAGYMARAFALAGVDVDLIEIRSQHNPLFPGLARPEPIPPHCQAALTAVAEHGASVGILNDGDGDRLGIVDECGIFIDQLRVMSLLAWGLLRQPETAGPVVRTITTSSMLDRLGELYGQPVFKTGVGMKFVAPKMIAEEAVIGGEESGGYVIARHMPERDGIYSGLAFLSLMADLEATPTELVAMLFEQLGRQYHYRRIDLRFDPAERSNINSRIRNWEPTSLIGQGLAERSSFDGDKFDLADGSWLLIRFSGTEPLLRIYAEAPSPQELESLLAAGRSTIGI